MAQMNTGSSQQKQAKGRESKFLTFELAGEEYGLEVLRVREIIGLIPVTRVPRTPDFIKGVINLRGKVVPVIDLRLRFSLPAEDYTDRTCIIVVDVEGSSGSILMGIVVDAVSEVLSIAEEEIEPTPSFGIKLDTDFILGMAKVKGQVKTLLDINKVLSTEQRQILGEIQVQPQTDA